MKLIEVKTITDIKEGDMLIINSDKLFNEPKKAHIVKVTKQDGTEIILDKKRNIFFNLGMYLDGRSWVKEVMILK